ncbi:3-hydroxyacyl-ACP dehydratase FabZ [Rhizomicrobium electricum]|jgi:3-hydroxyacyl-[acyl-carrier-protein] dehydratase|uniref:3-hydroxyacyl-[acyl-carrier-protein] dehydratase FabZ n=1 Tax=Rhizomicrobium electricum TaxID=480070 RepID=A0ABP3PPL5_9PROT|nr:3-hydroxyacyl-ACP dehydratase FabZ [Rhizomicrobium electricum]NIJ48944.1 3-hydroxyacyl-[acyl-carrier-protein] dehydratase [Rhizomicrobium electricum]
MTNKVEKIVLDVEAIKKLLPHRAPFLFIEKLTDIVPNESATGYKAVGYNEPHFAGHFPDHAVMPGVLIIEALAQAAGALVMYSLELNTGNRIVYFMTIEKARFRRPVKPGDMLCMKVKALRRRGPVWRFSGEAYVDDALCAEAEFSAMIQEGTDENGGASNGSR